MGKKLVYLVFDCETETLPFADTIAMGDAEKKKKIAKLDKVNKSSYKLLQRCI